MRNIYKNLVLITQIGINAIVPILMMTFIGIWVDKKLGFNMLFTLIFLVLGSMTGIYNIYKIGMEGNPRDKRSSKKDSR